MELVYAIQLLMIGLALCMISTRIRQLTDELRKLRQDDPERHRAF